MQTRLIVITLKPNIGVAEHVSFQWTDDFSIAASQDPFNNGGKIIQNPLLSILVLINSLFLVQFEPSTDIIDIKFGQSYTQEADWTTGTVDNDPAAPAKGFLFINKTNGAAAVVYRKINGAKAPIYYSTNAPLPPGTEEITPVGKIAVWFSARHESATMIAEERSAIIEVDFTARSQATVQYGAEGNWIVLP